MVMDRVLKRLAPERVVFSALGLREGLIYSQLTRQEQYLDPLLEGAQLIGLPLARVPDFAPALASWTADLFPGEPHAEARLQGRGLRAFGYRLERRAGPEGRRKLPPPAAIPVHRSESRREGFHRRRDPCALCGPARCAVAQAGGRPPVRCSSAPCAHSRTRNAARLSVLRRRSRGCSPPRACVSRPIASGSRSVRQRARRTAMLSPSVCACSPTPWASSAAKSSLPTTRRKRRGGRRPERKGLAMTERSPPIEIGFIVFPNVQQLDLTGPYEVFASWPAARVRLVWKTLDPVVSSTKLTLTPDATFAILPATRRALHSRRGRDQRASERRGDASASCAVRRRARAS